MRFWEQVTGSGADSKEPEGSTYEQLKMTLHSMNPSSRKLQESATAVLKNMTPLLQKCRSMSFRKMLMPNAAAVNRSSQLTELIKWQQEMFHRILNMMCLVEEGLSEQAELDAFRAELLHTLTTSHPNGEWADFTRDKLLFLQDLFQSKCISEEEYHQAKRPILSRLADQGAELDSQDFKFNSKAVRHTGESSSRAEMESTRNVAEVAQAPEAESPCDVPANSGSAKKTPIKHVMEAMARLKTVGSGGKSVPAGTAGSEEKPRVPHALDFVRRDPFDCPTRDAPIAVQKPQDVPLDSPLYFDASTGSTRDLLPELSNNASQTQDVEMPQSPGSVPSSPSIASFLSPPSVSSATLAEQSKSLLKPPRKLTFTPSKSTLTPSKTTVGFSRSQSTRIDSSSSPVVAKPERSLSRKFTGMFGKWQGWQTAEGQKEESDCDEDADSDDEKERTPRKTSVWKKLDLLRPASSKKQQEDDDDDFGKEISDKDPLLKAIDNYPSDKIKGGYIHGQGPDIKKLKKKVAVRAAPTNFFIDQVLGDNIKTELARIRAELARTNPVEQAFTNDQIDAIATRLPVDKTELMRFFPRSWCDRYGDIVLEVVHKEFNTHVSEMDGLRKAAKDKKAAGVKIPVGENDENKKAGNQTTTDNPPVTKSTPQSRTPSRPVSSKCYTTDGAEMKSASVHQQREFSPMTTPGGRARRGLGFENDLDVKLGAEILRMPFKNFNDATNVRS
ncbi:hypothetical protein MPTK1_8g12480 [Marchantia polymorpha subsp. ruderalis]|uniref:Uncharacterized protein n=1 Tax=Marchantia polymorpha TaxID=3197 RepID=A0A2R6WJT6_MARPO|nr:hypothetical protein MARPO_0083s0072 [Marchantia polymorpha]BBN19653.1 hypothetical protein Mp_8g12480 [Marchantia polymorpha subsp. ruderalis]|eukprot:PTQ34114.1 hypothetical protein MARPO_0083s0072 [Marchantia polymorpha]